MTVKELIEKLSHVDPDSTVWLGDAEYGDYEATEIKIGHTFIYVNNGGRPHKMWVSNDQVDYPWVVKENLVGGVMID